MSPRRTSLILLSSALVSAAVLFAAHAPTSHAAERSSRQVREDLRFAAKMAEKGLWREALFRWRRALESRPDDPGLRNNVAVALEALGERDLALTEYEKALAIAKSVRVRTNYELAVRAMEMSRKTEDEEATPGEDVSLTGDDDEREEPGG
ncbi:MAG: hypothetical protein OEQ13_09535 [Acidobacteriota bacterium]|nr:hypothetical protein [Acidobacteriota bacterium]